MVKKINNTTYMITEDLKDRMSDIISNLTVNRGIFSPIADRVLINTLLPRVVVDISYEYIKHIDKQININITYNSKEYIVSVANNSKLKGFIYNIVEV